MGDHHHIEAEPLVCEAQLKLMRSLGFDLKPLTDSSRFVEWVGHGICMQTDAKLIFTSAQALAKAVELARKQGEEKIQSGMRQILGLRNP